MQILVLCVIITIGLGIFWQHKYNLPPKTARLLPQSLLASTGDTPPVVATQPAAQIQLVHSVVVTPKSEALLANLYLQEVEHQTLGAWEGIRGRIGLETYFVQEGDTLWGIADQFGLDVDTLRWSNPTLERNPDFLPLNSELVILPVIGAYHTVSEDENLTSIALQYGVAEIGIINYPLNHLATAQSAHLKPGDKLVIPNGRKDINIPAPNPDTDYPLAWPLRGHVTQTYHDTHLAIDIGAPYGSKVYAAEAGVVIYAEWAQTGYGFTVMIDHGKNRKTLYSHLKGALVQLDSYVERGQVVGEVGSTGNSSGPHIHFEVRENNERLNPLNYLNPS